jgi:lysyl-tRNA synthetase class 2
MKSSWQPTASLQNLKKRADILTKIRAFFLARDVMEVETPLLCHATVTDAYIQSFETLYHAADLTENTATHSQKLYLQTSPEYCMKRLLAANSGAIYQICKSFRNYGEFGRFHNPEFTMLEWYRPNFTHHDLMDEVDDLLREILNCSPAVKISYADLFLKFTDINPHLASINELINCAKRFNLNDIAGVDPNNPNTWLHLLMSHVIEPKLDKDKPTFIFDFPMTQAALARIRYDDVPVAERFEVYVDGMELANGFHELCDAKEQRHRFEKDLAYRKQLHYPLVPKDEFFLAALENGLPNCSGVALGIDRLVMAALRCEGISDVVSFVVENA